MIHRAFVRGDVGGLRDRCDLLEILLDSGAEIEQRGINDWTPVHAAAASNDVRAVAVLVERGADPTARTRIDDRATPLEEATLLGKVDAAKLPREIEDGRDPRADGV